MSECCDVLDVSQVRAAHGSQPDVKEQTYEALRRVLLCLDPLLTTGGAGEEEPQLRMLQEEVTEHNAAQTHTHTHTHTRI